MNIYDLVVCLKKKKNFFSFFLSCNFIGLFTFSVLYPTAHWNHLGIVKTIVSIHTVPMVVVVVVGQLLPPKELYLIGLG